MKRSEVYNRIDQERAYQHKRWEEYRTGIDKSDAEKDVATWIIYMEKHIAEAKENLYSLHEHHALSSIRKVVALGVACMEIHGCPERINP